MTTEGTASDCISCGSEALLPYYERMFDDRYGYPGYFSIVRCPDCGQFATEPKLTDEELSETYTRYYPRSKIEPIGMDGRVAMRVNGTESLDTVLSQKLPKGQAIDFMSVDVEGFDLQVLRSNNWKLFRPEYVLVEALDFRLEQAAQHPIHRFMGGVGYELVAKTLNTLFYYDNV